MDPVSPAATHASDVDGSDVGGLQTPVPPSDVNPAGLNQGLGLAPPPIRPARQILSRVTEEAVVWFKTILSAAVYATIIVTFGVQVARVDGQSMAPTLADQDRLIVNKFEYRLPNHGPRVGDIVMLLYPENPDTSYVKRVVAEPGDTIRSVNGLVYRNDVPLPDDFISEEFRSYDTWGPEVVPEGYYFVMGDHRNNSSDSRAWTIPFVPKKYIIGRVQLRWWPLGHARIFEEWPHTTSPHALTE